jgi:hypothetical protein
MWTFVTGILLVGFNYHMNRANLGPNHTGMAMGVFIFPLFIYFLYDIVAKKVGGGAMSMPSLAVNLVSCSPATWRSATSSPSSAAARCGFTRAWPSASP